MADDHRTPPSEIEPEAVVEEEEDDCCTSTDRDRNSDASRGGEEDEEEEGSSGYFSRMLQKTVRGDDHDLERRIELIDKEEESLESRMIVRETTAEQVNRSMLFVSVNLEFVAGIYAYLRIRSRNLSLRGRIIRILPMFLVPALASFFYTFFSRFTSMLNLRDSRLLERLKKEREAKLQELKERARYYMTKTDIQNYHGESSSMASSSGPQFPEISHTRNETVIPSSSWGKSKLLHLERNTCHDAPKLIVKNGNSKKKLKSLVICSTCRMHNGFASKDELPSISYKCPHCNASNGPLGSASTSAEGAPQSQPYNPFSIREMPRGIFIEEITPNHETTDPEMDAPIMIIRESPTMAGREELQSASTPDTFIPASVRKLPNGLSIEEMPSNEETTTVEMESPVMVIPESPAAVTSLMVPEMVTSLSVEEINPNDQQVEDNEAISPIMIVQESPLASSLVELLSNQNSDTVAPFTVPEFPSGLSIEEMTPNQEMADPETEGPEMIITESPSAGIPVSGDSSFVTPILAKEMASGLSIEEVSPNHQLTDDCKMDPAIMFVQESPSFGGQELSVSTPDPSAGTSVTVPEVPGFFDNDMPGSSHNDSLQRYLHGNGDVHGPVKTTAATGPASLTESQLQSENGSVTDDGNYDSDSNSWRSYSSDGLNPTTNGPTLVEETQIAVGEMATIDTRDGVEGLEEEVHQQGPRSLVSENSDSAEESLGRDDPNYVGSVAYDRDKGSASQNLRGVGGMKKDRITKKKNRQEGERVEDISDKEGSLRKQEIKPKPVVMASAALLSPNSDLDSQSGPFTGIVSSPAPQWDPSTEFEPARAVGLRHRK